MPNTLTKDGMISAQTLLYSPMLSIRMKVVIIVTCAGTIMVKFANGKSYVGDIKLTSKTFTYKLDIESNFMFSAEANGKIDLDAETNILTLTVNGTFKYNNDSYTSAVTLTLKQKANVQ